MLVDEAAVLGPQRRDYDGVLGFRVKIRHGDLARSLRHLLECLPALEVGESKEEFVRRHEATAQAAAECFERDIDEGCGGAVLVQHLYIDRAVTGETEILDLDRPVKIDAALLKAAELFERETPAGIRKEADEESFDGIAP